MFRLIVLVSYILFATAKLPIDIPRIENVKPVADDSVISYRLPNNSRPETYDVSLRTNIHEGNFEFNGTVKIGVLVLADTDTITMHHRQLNIERIAVLMGFLPIEIELDTYSYDPVTEFLSINMPFHVVADERFEVIIDYTGTLRNDEAGFYFSYYNNNAGERRYLATTQFESTDARHGFPCYDEPALKANYTIRITHDVSYSAISNMPVKSRQQVPESDMWITEFESTPPTSSYLIAFIVSDFAYYSNENNIEELPHRVFARPNAIHLTNLTLESGILILDALANYLQVGFSLPKMDQAAIPHFAAGAMENWGLVTYRETAFFWDDETSVYTTKLSIVRVIAHEFAHQWFGNLVSPRWWTYLWLNEGFATLYANYATDLVHPDWRLMEYMVVNTLQNVFVSDASGLSRPMSYYVESPGAIQSIFDNIAYDKSGCVLRMFMNALSDSTFSKGLYYYLLDRSYDDATEEDLFNGIERAAKEDGVLSDELHFPTIMASWTQQSGFPILYVNRNYNDGSITITQERFLTYPTGTISHSTFWIPINFATAQNSYDFDITTADDWLSGSEGFKIIEQMENKTWTDDDWVIFNKQQAGYYRVQYDRRNWNLITDELNNGDFNRIHLLSRSQLIDDSFTFARTSRISWDIPFNILQYLEHEHEYAPWVSATNHLNYLNRFVTGLSNYPLYRTFVSGLTEHILEYVGIEDIENEPLLRKYSRTIAINWSCTFGSMRCRQITNDRITQLITNGDEIHQNLKNVLYCAGLRNGNANAYDYFFNRMLENVDEQLMIINALGCISNENILLQYLENSLNNTLSQTIRQGIFNSVYQNSKEGYEMALAYLYSNFENAYVIFGSDAILGNTIASLANRATKDNHINQIENLMQIVDTNSDMESYITTANNYIFQNIQWSVINGILLDDWLMKNVENN